MCAHPTGYSPSGSSVQGIFPGKSTEIGSHFLLHRIFPTRDRIRIFCNACGFFSAEPLVSQKKSLINIYWMNE